LVREERFHGLNNLKKIESFGRERRGQPGTPALGNVSKCATVRYSALQRAAFGYGTSHQQHCRLFYLFFNRALQEGIEAEQKGTKHKDFLVPSPEKTQPGPDGPNASGYYY